jgi:hypothetical protein
MEITPTDKKPSVRFPLWGDQDKAEIADMMLLLPSMQVAALESLAHQKGLTVGQLIRGLIRQCLAGGDGSFQGMALERT